MATCLGSCGPNAITLCSFLHTTTIHVMQIASIVADVLPHEVKVEVGEKICAVSQHLEAQQRYFSYRAILAATVSQKPLVLVFYGVSPNYRTIRCKNGVSHRCACVKLSTNRGLSHHFGGVQTSLTKYRAIWGIAAIVSQYRAIWGH